MPNDNDLNENGPGIPTGAAPNHADLWKRQHSDNSTALSKTQYALVESSGIRHAIVDEKPIRAGYVDVAVTRRVDVRATGCTCAVAAPCLCCRSFHAATVAREARQGALR